MLGTGRQMRFNRSRYDTRTLRHDLLRLHPPHRIQFLCFRSGLRIMELYWA